MLKQINIKLAVFNTSIIKKNNFLIFTNKWNKNEMRQREEENEEQHVTYVTHCDYTYIDNLIELSNKWRAPISIAIYAPGDDFLKTLDSIRFLKKCITPENSRLLNKFVSFHVYFDKIHSPNLVIVSHD